MKRIFFASGAVVVTALTFGLLVALHAQATQDEASLEKDPTALLTAYRHVEVASVWDAMEKITGLRMYMSHRMRPIFPSKFAGIALTVKLKNEENRDPDALQGMLAAIDQGGPNSV